MSDDRLRIMAREFVARQFSDLTVWFDPIWDLLARRELQGKQPGMSLGAAELPNALAAQGGYTDPRVVEMSRAMLVLIDGCRELLDQKKPKKSPERVLRVACDRYGAQNLYDPILQFILKSPQVDSGARQGRAVARKWTWDTPPASRRRGEPLTRSELEEIEAHPENFELLILDYGEAKRDSIGRVYFDGDSELKAIESARGKNLDGPTRELKPFEYRILILIAKRPDGIELWEMVRDCWKMPKRAEELASYLAIEERQGRPFYNTSSSRYRGDISKLNRLLRCYLGGRYLKSFQKRKYRFNRLVRACVIEVSPS